MNKFFLLSKNAFVSEAACGRPLPCCQRNSFIVVGFCSSFLRNSPVCWINSTIVFAPIFSRDKAQLLSYFSIVKTKSTTISFFLTCRYSSLSFPFKLCFPAWSLILRRKGSSSIVSEVKDSWLKFEIGDWMFFSEVDSQFFWVCREFMRNKWANFDCRLFFKNPTNGLMNDCLFSFQSIEVKIFCDEIVMRE